MSIILIGILKCSKLTYDSFVLVIISPPLPQGQKPQTPGQVLMSGEEKKRTLLGKGEGGLFYQEGKIHGMICQKHYYTIARLDIASCLLQSPS